VDALSALGLDGPKVVRRFPVVLGLNSNSVHNRTAFLKRHGLDPVRRDGLFARRYCHSFSSQQQ